MVLLRLMLLALILAMCLGQPQSAFATGSRPAYEAVKVMTPEHLAYYKDLFQNGCLKKSKKLSDTECAGLYAALIMDLYAKGKYNEASKMLPAFYKHALSSTNEVDCPYGSFWGPEGGHAFNVSYYEAAYLVFEKIDKAKSAKYAIRAFMCATDSRMQQKTPPQTIDDVKMGRNEFVLVMKSLHANDPAYDAGRVFDEVIVPLTTRYYELRKNKSWGKNPQVDAKDSAEISALIGNAIKYLKAEKFAKEFIDYYVDARVIFTKMVTVDSVRKIVQ